MLDKFSKHKVTPKLFLKTLVYSVKLMFSANKFAAILISFGEIINAIIPSVQAVLLGFTINTLVARDWNGFLLMLSLTIFATISQQILGNLNGYFSLKLQFDVQNFSTEQLYIKVSKIPIAVRETKENADKLELAESYALSLGWMFPQVMRILSGIVALIAAAVVLVNVSWLVAVILTILVIPNAILTVKKMLNQRKFWKQNSVHRRRGWGLRDQFTHPDSLVELKLNGIFGYFIREWRKHITADRRDEISMLKKYLRWDFLALTLQTVANVGILAWVGREIILGRIEVGFLMTIQRLIDNFYANALSITQTMAEIGGDLLKAKDFFDYLELPEEQNGTIKIAENQPPKIEFRDVSFTYPLADAPAISRVSFTIEPGEGVALVGENGSGKTTLIKLLLGLYEPNSGEILIDGHNLRDIDKNSYYKVLGALFQDFAHYDFANLEENIWYGDISRKPLSAELMKVVEKAKLAATVANLPHGLKQILSKRFDDENGTDLSGGQWQRLALARGFWRQPEVLILDEPTAAVDAKAEYEIFREIAATQEGKTTIIISHRFSTVRKAARIFVIAGGEIIENGSHAELMKRNGLYAEMFNLQAEGYK